MELPDMSLHTGEIIVLEDGRNTGVGVGWVLFYSDYVSPPLG